jgi:hypothetical protein
LQRIVPAKIAENDIDCVLAAFAQRRRAVKLAFEKYA